MQTKPNTSKLLLLILSCLPGAGHMYMGLMKTGISFMVLFFGVIALGTELYMNFFFLLLPIIWFYSFFDVWNKEKMSFDEYSQYKDTYLFIGDQKDNAARGFAEKYKNGIGMFAIVFGLYLLFRRAVLPYLYKILPSGAEEYVRQFADSLPQIIIAVVIICAGFYLIGGKKREIEKQRSEVSKQAMAAAYAAYNRPSAPVLPVSAVPEEYVDVQSDSSKETDPSENPGEDDTDA